MKGGSQTEEQPAAASDETGKEQAPTPVQVVNPVASFGDFARSAAMPVLGPLGTGLVVIVFVIFMLLKKEDLRNRVIHLAGRSRLSLTTRTLQEAGTRVSRYLLMQLLVNVTYGISIGIGLMFIGLPNALLWGMLTAVLRFIPYIGPWIGAFFPFALSIAVSNSWTMPILTVALFIVVELISNNIIEPWLYGSSTGAFASSDTRLGGFLDMDVGPGRTVACHAADGLPRGNRKVCASIVFSRCPSRRRTFSYRTRSLLPAAPRSRRGRGDEST